MSKYFVILSILTFSLMDSYAQKKVKPPSYFGIQFRPIIPSNILSKSTISLSDSNFSGTFAQKQGYSFGASIRVGLTKLISLETGINQVKRNYQVNFEMPDSTLSGSTSFGVLSYDIPINGLFYIQLSKKIFTNVSLGTSFVNYPSNVGATTIVNEKHLFISEARRIRRFDFELNANLGFELRTEKHGFFYLGGSAKLPFAPILKVAASYEYDNSTERLAIGNVQGSYVSLDFKYFFHNVKTKGQQFNSGPIE